MCRRFSSCQSCSLTPCQGLNKYLIDPCLIFNRTIVPITPVPSIPPMPPIIGSASFETNVLLENFDDIPFNIILSYVSVGFDGDTDITLFPNRTYFFSWVIETQITSRSFTVGGALINLTNNVPVSGGTNTTSIERMPRIAIASAMGVIVNGANPIDLSLEFLSNI